MKFDPFKNRLCHDIRNDLSESLVDALRTKNLQLTRDAAALYLEKGVDSVCRTYINSRLSRYKEVFTLATPHNFDDIFRITLYLWDEELFFEVHDYLEFHWMKSSGDNKSVLQAMIRAAGTYVHLEQGNLKGAEKMATKAVTFLDENQQLIPSFFNVELLISKLKKLDPVPPKLI